MSLTSGYFDVFLLTNPIKGWLWDLGGRQRNTSASASDSAIGCILESVKVPQIEDEFIHTAR
jgi:hypothetical protein